MQLVVERLSGPVVHVYPQTPLGVCARAMLRHRIRHLPVVDEAGAPLGMIEDLTVFQHGALLGPEQELWLAFDEASDGIHAVDLMVPFGGRCSPGTSTLVAMVTLAERDGAALAVVDDEGVLVGLVTEHDAVIAARDLVDATRLVCDFATADVVSVDTDLLAFQALQMMVDRSVRHLVVVDDGALFGVISHRDMIAESVTQRRTMTVHDAMRVGAVHTTTGSNTLHEAAGLMVREHVGCLPVLSADGALEGILTRSDMLRAALQALEGKRDLSLS